MIFAVQMKFHSFDRSYNSYKSLKGIQRRRQRQKQPQKSNDLIGWMKETNRAARPLVEFFDAVCQTTTWNFQIYGFNENVNAQRQQIIHSLYLILRRSY